MAQPMPSSLIDRRREQMFPVLTSAQVESARRFGGAPLAFEAGKTIFTLGQLACPALLVMAGSIEIVRRDGLGHSSVVTTHGPNQIAGELSQLAGGPSLVEVRAGPEGCVAILFIGADPNAEWLKECAVIVDAKGFVQTGDAIAPGYRDDSATRQLPRETSQPGVFAVGDVHAGSVKRVASAVGEGAAVVAQIHGYFEELKKSQPTGEKA